jgi:hypothetical protein
LIKLLQESIDLSQVQPPEMKQILIFSLLKMENLTEYKELKAVELKLEELTALLDKDKKSLTPSERRKVDNYDSNLAELKADKAKWFELLRKAQGIVQVA